MLPIWIIDLGEAPAVTEKLRGLLDAAGEEVKPYWHYCHIEAVAEGMDGYRGLMETLVADGRECYNTFVKAGFDVGNFQIVVIGAADERSSQHAFAPLAGLIRDNLPRIVFDHANRGVEITGILYIPSTINQTDDVERRVRAAMLLEEVNTLSERLGAKHFNHVVAYQDVQYNGARFYNRLDDIQRTELLYQILVNLYFTGARSERLFDKTGQGRGVFSLGVASIYYNSEQHRGQELRRLLEKIIAEFKEEGNADSDYSNMIVRETFEDDTLDADIVATRLRSGCGSVDIDLKKVEGEADPHPVWDLFRVDLFPRYYRKYLKYMPARLTRFMQSLSYILLTRFSTALRRNREMAVEHHIMVLRSLYRKVFLDTSSRFATIAQMESVYSCAKNYVLKKRSEVMLTQTEVVPVPEYLRNDYDKCIAAEEANKPMALMEKIKKNLKKEPVVLGLAVRCFFLGILLVFIIIPVLRVISPTVVNLGEIATLEWLWIPILFLLPFVVNFFIRLRRHFKRIKRLRRRMLAAILLSANRRLSQVLMDEQGAFYDALVAESEAQLKLLAAFREQLMTGENEVDKSPIPRTMFNQPLLDGDFCGERMLKDDSIAEAEIQVNDIRLRLSQLEEPDLLVMMKGAFRQPEVLEASDLSDSREVVVHVSLFVEAMAKLFGPQMQIHSAENIGLMLGMLDRNVDVTPFVKMAGTNGMLFSVKSSNKPMLRIPNTPPLFSDIDVTSDKSTSDYAMLTSWQQVTLQSQQICNCSIEPLPALSLADKLTLYYAYYRQRDLAYTLAGQPVRLSRDEMESLDKQIIGG